MAELTSGIFAAASNLQARQVFDICESLQAGEVGYFSFPEAYRGPEVGLSRASVMWDGMDVSALQRAYITGFNYNNPIVPRALTNVDWSLWQTDYIAEQQKSSFMYSAFSEMARRGVDLSNSPEQHVLTSMKVDLLARLDKGGVSVAKTLCTNLRSEADAFVAENELVLWRTVTGRAAWQLCLERQLDALISTEKPPVLLADVTEGSYLRCFLLRGKPVLCLRYAAPIQTPLERLEVFVMEEESELQNKFSKLSALLKLPWALVHCVVKDGDITVYDVDSDPILEQMPLDVQSYLNLCLAHDLLAEPLPSAEHLSETALVREMPFLRRMLTVLFDIERKKYTPLQ